MFNENTHTNPKEHWNAITTIKVNYIEELEEFVVKILEEEKAKGKPDEEKDLEDQETKEENLKN